MKDYLFYAMDNEETGMVDVMIVKKSFFEKHGFIEDAHIGSDELGDLGFDEIAEGMFIFDGTLQEAKDKLTELGLTEEPALFDS